MIALALLTLLATAPAPDATPDPATVYTDPAMTLVVPPVFKKAPIPQHDPLQFENRTVVAAFVRNAQTHDQVMITVSMEDFEKPDAAAYTQSADNDARNGKDDVFIKRYPTQLSNGMPAVFEEVTMGEGFGEIVTYRYVWADGARGVIVAETALNGVIDATQAKRDLQQLSATAYPRNRY